MQIDKRATQRHAGWSNGMYDIWGTNTKPRPRERQKKKKRKQASKNNNIPLHIKNVAYVAYVKTSKVVGTPPFLSQNETNIWNTKKTPVYIDRAPCRMPNAERRTRCTKQGKQQSIIPAHKTTTTTLMAMAQECQRQRNCWLTDHPTRSLPTCGHQQQQR